MKSDKLSQQSELRQILRTYTANSGYAEYRHLVANEDQAITAILALIEQAKQEARASLLADVKRCRLVEKIDGEWQPIVYMESIDRLASTQPKPNNASKDVSEPTGSSTTSIPGNVDDELMEILERGILDYAFDEQSEYRAKSMRYANALAELLAPRIRELILGIIGEDEPVRSYKLDGESWGDAVGRSEKEIMRNQLRAEQRQRLGADHE
jgi:hypothetical protein